MKKRIFILITISLISVLSFEINPQTKDNKTYFWLNFGGGFLNAKNFPGFAVYLGASLHSQGKQISIKYCTSARISGFIEPCNSTAYFIIPYKIKAFAVLFGINPRKKYLSFAALTGLSYVWGRDKVKYNLDHYSGGRYITYGYENFRSIGLPVEFSLTLIPLPAIGISGILSLNVNSSHFFTGTYLIIQFGYVRAK